MKRSVRVFVRCADPAALEQPQLCAGAAQLNGRVVDESGAVPGVTITADRLCPHDRVGRDGEWLDASNLIGP
jgi:hypothetical protein